MHVYYYTMRARVAYDEVHNSDRTVEFVIEVAAVHHHDAPVYHSAMKVRQSTTLKQHFSSYNFMIIIFQMCTSSSR
jgi:hypothetical protein